MRFNSTNHRSLNESINKVQNPQQTLEEALEYNRLLESVLEELCEELDLDPQELGEGVIRNVVQRVKNKLRGDGFRTDRDIEAERAEDRRADKEQLDAERRERAWRAEQRKKGLGKKKKLPKNVWVDRVDAGELPSKFREWDRRQKERLDSIGR